MQNLAVQRGIIDIFGGVIYTVSTKNQIVIDLLKCFRNFIIGFRTALSDNRL